MKIALEGSSLFFNNYTGIPFYIQNLYHSLKHSDEADPYLAFRLKNKLKSKNGLHPSIRQEQCVWHYRNLTTSKNKFSVSHSLHTPFLALPKTLKVATVHDLAVHLPLFKSYDFATPYFAKKRMELFKQFSKKADAIITVSETTKNDFIRFFDFPHNKIHVVPLAPSLKPFQGQRSQENYLDQLDLTDKGYYISLGGVSLRKNTLNLVKGYALSKMSTSKKLVITGKIENTHYPPLKSFIDKNRLGDKVIITGYLSDSRLRTLYHNASGFLFPTFYEGFGIPILEAMINELPVLTSNIGAAPETASDKAVLVDPFVPESIADGIDSIPNIDSAHLERAKTYASSFTWAKTAQETIEVYKKYV